MSRHTPWPRLIAGLTLLLALVATPAIAASAQAGESFIEFHLAECPADAADLFAECHGNRIAGVGIIVGGMGGAYEVITDSAGVAGAVHGAGTLTVAEDPAVVAGYLGVYVYCSLQNADPQTVLFDGLADIGLFTLEVGPGDEVVCDVYNLTTADPPSAAPAAITIHYRSCPVDFAGDLFLECHDNALTGPFDSFAIDGPATAALPTDVDGNVVFADLPAGSYTIQGPVPQGGDDQLAIFCSDATEIETPFPFGNPQGPPTAQIALDLAEGDQVVCDWYLLPLPNVPGDVGTVVPPPSGLVVTQLPNTGAGPIVDGAESGGGWFLTALLLIGVAASGRLRRRLPRFPSPFPPLGHRAIGGDRSRRRSEPYRAVKVRQEVAPMDTRFDYLARRLAARTSRRRFARSGGLALAALAGWTVVGGEAAEARRQRGVQVFTAATPTAAGDATAADVHQDQHHLYCVYQIVRETAGACGPAFSVGDVLCIDCPNSLTCPTRGGRTSRFRFVDAGGNTICEGEWQNRYDARKGFDCGACRSDHAGDPNGKTGFRFV